MRNTLLCLSVLLLISCSRKFYVQEAYLLEDKEERLPDNRVDIKTFYAGDAFRFITFQVDVENRSGDTIYLDTRDIALSLEEAGARRIIHYPIPKKDILYELNNEADFVEDEKKSNTALNIFFSGMDVLGAALGGANTGETILYGASSAIYILDERERYNIAQGSIEDQIAYHEDYTLDKAMLAPGESGTYDIHFDRLMTDGDAIIKIHCADQVYSFDFEMEVVKVRG